LEQIRVYGERAAIIEELGWIDAFKRGWQVLKDNLAATVIFWILFAALGVLLFIVMFVAMLGLAVPAFIGIALLEPQTWMILPGVCFGLLFIIFIAVVKSVITTYISSSWTLAYREMTIVEPGELEALNSG
jgi:hypothetical protein